MHADTTDEQVLSWEELDRFLKTSKSLDTMSSDQPAIIQRTRQPPYLNLHDNSVMPTESEIALLRAARSSSDADFNELLNVIHDENFRPDRVRFQSAKQAKTFLKNSTSRLLNLDVLECTIDYQTGRLKQ